MHLYTLDGNVDINGTKSVFTDLSLNGVLYNDVMTIFSDKVDITGNVDISGNLDIDGDVDISGNVDISGGKLTIGPTNLFSDTQLNIVDIRPSVNPDPTISAYPTFSLYCGDAAGSVNSDQKGFTNTVVGISERAVDNSYNHLYGMVLGVGAHPTIGFKTKSHLNTNNGLPTGVIELVHGNSTETDLNEINNTSKTVIIDAGGDSYFNGGNVGIGTNSPEAKLDIEVANNNSALYIGEISTKKFGLKVKNGSSDTLVFSSEYDNSITDNILTLRTDGNVGIGTDSPNANLDISGNVNIVGNIDISGDITIQQYYVENGISPKLLFYGPPNANFGEAGITFVGGPRGVEQADAYLNFFTNGVTTPDGEIRKRMTISNLGNVGIGTLGSFPLHVIGGGNWSDVTTDNAYGFNTHSVDGLTVFNDTTGNFKKLGDGDVTAYFENYITSKGYVVPSDKRIKENIRDVSDNNALQKLRDISCVNYEYRDKLARGTRTTIGFIAQQVKEHMPMAILIQKDIIPNEMRNSESPIWTTITDSSGNNTYKLTINDLSDNSGNTLYRFYVSNDPSGNDECKKEIYSLENEPKSFMFDQSWNNVFIYGKQVDDFHTLDKQKLFALNFSATQEIDRIQRVEKRKLEEAESKIATLEAENATLKSQIADILSRLQTLENA